MRVFVPRETGKRETRAALTPDAAKRLAALGMEVRFEPGLGHRADFEDAAYEAAGAVAQEKTPGLAEADVVLCVSPPPPSGIRAQKPGSLLLGFLDPFPIHLGPGDPPVETETSLRLRALEEAGITGVSVELMPRSTLAQSMDALSSQANLAGYMAAILAARRLNKIFPMMMTPAGTISPARVFVIGIGVAGLQAIATAKRLGARITAFDTRPEALEQAESLGAKALRIDLGATRATDQGYATELTPEQLEIQRREQARICTQSDVVITTAKLFGRKAPLLLRREVIDAMPRGSVVVDLAAETGGNVEGTVLGEEFVTPNGVRLIGHAKLETFLPRDASLMYANNLCHFLEHFWDRDALTLRLDLQDSILKSCVLTHGGSFIHPHPAFAPR